MNMYLLNVYIPNLHLEKVKKAIFEAGAGKLGDYENCCWQTEGIGQFKPLKNSNPNMGNKYEINKIPETKVEFLCQEDKLLDIIQKMKKNHPYEEVAYHIIKIENI